MTPAQTLYLEVDILGGAAGQIVKGFTDSGVGGGESDVRTCPAAGTCSSGTSLASRLLVAGTVTVTFGGHPAAVAFVRPGEIGVISPPGTGTVDVVVTVGGVSSQVTPADRFTYTGFFGFLP